MEERAIPPADQPLPSIADAASLFDQGEGTKADPPRVEASPSERGGSYDVEDLPVKVSPQEAQVAIGSDSNRKGVATKPGMRIEPSDAVEHVWTRWGEWGGTITTLVIAAFALFVLIYLLLSWEFHGPAFLAFLLGGILLTYLAYPIMITLERPVRVTPEQAVKDYFAALSHHFPHYRRMWLLLSGRGKVTGSFASFEGFKEYWSKTQVELRSGKTSGITPLRFSVEDFKCPKSAGLSTIEASYTVNVLVRGRQDSGAVHSFKVKSSLVKGPDRMWYLDHGTLP